MKIEKLLQKYIINLKDITSAYIFSSYVKDKLKSKSDIDIALLFVNYKKQDVHKLKLMTDMSEIIKRDVDLIIINESSPRLYHEILKSSKLIVDIYPDFRKKYEVRQKKFYEDYMHIHKIYMDGIRARYGK